LFSILLGVAFKAFGISEAVARGFALFIEAVVVISSGWLAKLRHGTRADVAAVFSMLTVPIFLAHVRLVQLTTLGIFFVLLALIGYFKATRDDTLNDPPPGRSRGFLKSQPYCSCSLSSFS
jgi:4-amino-4-deoxy-L-arabinose transferase-like glycosyltransferase